MRTQLLPLVLFGCASLAAGPEKVPAPPPPASSTAVAPAPAAVEGPPRAAGESLHGLTVEGLDGVPVDLASYRGKAVLFVNVASRCGFTPQYEGLQKLHEKMAGRGLVIVGVPCNQFGAQEPGSADEIASFCKMNYGVTFPLLAKQDVNGQQRSPLYRLLVDSKAGGGKAVRWNFEKFLVSPAGEVVARFPSSTDPEDASLLAAIESVLPK
jgi:glutathione peroxidase